MNITIRKVATTLGAIAVVSFGNNALAERNGDPAYLTEIDSCVSELVSRIDVSAAERVRHVITKSKRSRLGYALNFKTTVFSAGAESSYSVYCVAKGAEAPIRFRFKELSG